MLLCCLLAISICIEFWYIVLPIFICYVVYVVREVRKEANTDFHHTQTPILQPSSSSAEQLVMNAIHRRVAEYEPLQSSGIYATHMYSEEHGLHGLECEMNALRKNQKDVGCFYAGDYHFCTGPKLSVPQEIHFSRYFNEQCDKHYKQLPNRGIERCTEDITVLADYMLTHLDVSVRREYVALKIYEAQLRFHMWRLKSEQLQREKEERQAQRDFQRAINAALRNEGKARQQLEEQRKALEQAETERERTRLQSRIKALEIKLSEALSQYHRAKSMAQQTRAGYVYIIANERSFGPGVLKIGMTRRIDPMERINELGDASVPFPFDVHRLIYTDDAPTLEAQLHQRFADRRMNAENNRKEFFRVSLPDVLQAIDELTKTD